MKVACYCGTVYSFLAYSSSGKGVCPTCLTPTFGAVREHAETAAEFANRTAEFIKTSGEIASLPEVER